MFQYHPPKTPSGKMDDMTQSCVDIASSTQVMEVDDLDTLFNRPLSQQAYTQLQDLQIDLTTMPYNVDQTDTWVFIWGSH